MTHSFYTKSRNVRAFLSTLSFTFTYSTTKRLYFPARRHPPVCEASFRSKHYIAQGSFSYEQHGLLWWKRACANQASQGRHQSRLSTCHGRSGIHAMKMDTWHFQLYENLRPPAEGEWGVSTDNLFTGKLKNKILAPALMREILICTMLVAKEPDCRLPKLLAVLFKEVSKWDYASDGNWIEKVPPALASQSWNQQVTQFSKFFSSWVANTSPIIHAPQQPLLAFSQKLR